MTAETPRCGMIALVGRPNVGKSSLLNQLVGEKVSIVTPKPQTTRHRIVAVRNEPHAQFAFVDTPGLHDGGRKAMNRLMNRTAQAALDGVDAVVVMVAAPKFSAEDEAVLARVGSGPRVVAVINQIDRLRSRDKLIPLMQQLASRGDYAAVVPISARTGENLDRLLDVLRDLLPEGPPLFDTDKAADHSERFVVAEMLREKLMLALEQELPYAVTVVVDQLADEGGLVRIAATIWVEREGQQSIVIGKGGAMLREVGRAARLELEERWGKKVFMQLWVKVRAGWSDDERVLRSLGFEVD
jgi:GTP-binding protein Era